MSFGSARLPRDSRKGEHGRSCQSQTARPLMSLGRRRFLAAVAGSLLAAPLAAGAQQPSGKVPRVGVVGLHSRELIAHIVHAIEAGLRRAQAKARRARLGRRAADRLRVALGGQRAGTTADVGSRVRPRKGGHCRTNGSAVWRSRMPRWGYAVVCLMTVSLLQACGSASPPLLEGSIKVDQGANPNPNGRASPIVVRVYELRSSAAFSGADFFSLFDNESATLAGDLVGREEYDLSPAETQPYRRQLQPDTKFIGVVAAFRDLENSRWRQVVPVPDEPKSPIAIGIEARAV